MIYQWNNTPQLCLSFTADSTQSPTVVTLMQLFHSPALLARNSVLVVSGERAIFVWPWKMLPVSVICFISRWMKRSKHGLFVFPPKKTLIWRRHWSIGQSLMQFDVKAKSHARLCPFAKPIKSLYFRSFVVSALFARFHFKVMRKSLWHSIITLSLSPLICWTVNRSFRYKVLQVVLVRPQALKFHKNFDHFKYSLHVNKNLGWIFFAL